MCLNMWGHMVELRQGRLKLKIVLGLCWPCTQVSVADVSIFFCSSTSSFDVSAMCSLFRKVP